jgi:endoglucanase
MMKYANRIAIAALAFFALCGGASATPVEDHGQLSVKNARIVDKNGNMVQLRGMSFFWDQWSEGSRFYNSGVVNTLVNDWKVSVVRVAYSGTKGNKELAKAVINAAIDKGIYVIIDWHSHTADNETSAAKTFFKEMAEAYGNKPNIIYEVFNEPIEQKWPTIKTYAEAVIEEIRKVDNKNIILVGTRDYSKRVDEAAANPISADKRANVAYVAHFYAAQEGHGNEIRSWIRTALNAGLAVFITEMGTTEASGRGDVDTKATDTWLSFLDQYQISWANWSITDKETDYNSGQKETSAALKPGVSTNGSGWSTSNYTESGLYIYNKLRFYASTKHTLSITINGTGTVTRIPDFTSYTYGTPVTLIAKPGAGGAVAGWGGDISSKSDTVEVSMTANRSVTVTFGEAGNLIQNGSFVSSISPWQITNSAVADPLPNAKLDFQNSEAKITMTIAGTAVDHAYMFQNSIALKKGRKYKLTFTARGASARSLTAKVVNGNTALMTPYEVSLTTSKQTFSTTFEMTAADVTNAAVRFCFGGNTTGLFITDISLVDVGSGTGVLPRTVAAQRSAWSIANVGGALRISGPMEAGAKVSLYDTRGKVVKSAAVMDGMTLTAAGIPAGSYLAVVKNRAGAEVYKARVSFVR